MKKAGQQPGFFHLEQRWKGRSEKAGELPCPVS